MTEAIERQLNRGRAPDVMPQRSTAACKAAGIVSSLPAVPVRGTARVVPGISADHATSRPRTSKVTWARSSTPYSSTTSMTCVHKVNSFKRDVPGVEAGEPVLQSHGPLGPILRASTPLSIK